MAPRKLIAAALAAAAALGLAACGETPQVTVYKQGKYQGKPDTKPWDNDPKAINVYTTSSWTKGDKASWERAVNTRALAQNEYTRTE
jgi:hypothetical protein